LRRLAPATDSHRSAHSSPNRTCRGAWTLPPNRRTGGLVCVQPGARCVG
jgi:hypothetical protein